MNIALFWLCIILMLAYSMWFVLEIKRWPKMLSFVIDIILILLSVGVLFGTFAVKNSQVFTDEPMGTKEEKQDQEGLVIVLPDKVSIEPLDEERDAYVNENDDKTDRQYGDQGENELKDQKEEKSGTTPERMGNVQTDEQIEEENTLPDNELQNEQQKQDDSAGVSEMVEEPINNISEHPTEDQGEVTGEEVPEEAGIETGEAQPESISNVNAE